MGRSEAGDSILDFADKVAVVTGGANGIGRATALRFSAVGASVVVVDHDEAAGEELVREIKAVGRAAIFHRADVTRSGDVAAYVEAASRMFGRIDCFFNNAGIEGTVASIADYDEDMFDRIVAVNLRGVFLGLKHVLPVMLRQGSGAIVNSSSVAGLAGAPRMAAYSATKHAVLGLTKSAAGEVARSGVRVNAVCPGPVDTRMIHSLEAQVDPADPNRASAMSQNAIPLGRYGRADEIADVVLFLCSPGSSNITGSFIVADGGRTSIGSTVSVAGGARNT